MIGEVVSKDWCLLHPHLAKSNRKVDARNLLFPFLVSAVSRDCWVGGGVFLLAMMAVDGTGIWQQEVK